jgi:uncharacterized membrane protein YoaK (UPF0700 family)
VAVAVSTPAKAPVHPWLPRLLITLTFVTGMVDAVSYLGLGHTFVANMTGNVVFLGFGLAGGADLSVAAALVSVGAFAAGAVLGGRLTRRLGEPRQEWLVWAIGLELLLVAVAALVSIGLQAGDGDDRGYAVIAVLALAMGIRNATVRALAVPDLTTTVLTLTVTGLAADSPAAGGTGAASRRRLTAVTAMLLGALAGGLLVVGQQLVLALGVLTALLAATFAVAVRVLR